MAKKLILILMAVLILPSIFSVNISVSAQTKTLDFDITAKAGMLISMDTGEILFEKDINKKIYPASITKIMTAIIILESEKYNPDSYIKMSQNVLNRVSATGSAVSDLKNGEAITHKDLMHLIIMCSYGDCAYLAAQYFGGSVEGFVNLMNQKTEKLGLSGTKYTNPIGLHDKNNYTTVKDIQKLTEYALKNETFKKICETAHYNMPATNMSGARIISSTNLLLLEESSLYYPYVKGVKTGFTQAAGRCLVTTASYNNCTYMCVVVGCPANDVKHFTESTKLYNWAFNNFSFKEITSSTETAAKMPVQLSADTDLVDLNFKETFIWLLPNNTDESEITINKKLNTKSVEAPIKKGDILGTAEIVYNGQVIGSVELVAANDVERSSFLSFLKNVKVFFISPVMKFVYIIIGLSLLAFIAYCIMLNMDAVKKIIHEYFPKKK